MTPRHLALAVTALTLACREPLPADGIDDAGRPDVAQDTGISKVLRDPRRVRVATFNVRRFFDPTCDSGRCGGDEYEELPTPEMFARRADQIAYAIERLDVDVVLLQEVETATSLRALSARLGPAWPTAALGEIGTPASVDVAVVARDRLVAVRTHRERVLLRPDGSETTFSRELLEVELDHAGRTVIAFAAHLRSMVSDDPGRRLAEAQAAREIVSARAVERRDALVVLGGDCNDTPGSATLLALEEGGRLERATEGRAAEDIATYVFGGAGVALDHVYRARDGSGALVPAEVATRWDALPARGYGGSDHAALRVVYAFAD
jgi:endonuclease/exonuclease/phosphatase family metal-dependent hydrolase